MGISWDLTMSWVTCHSHHQTYSKWPLLGMPRLINVFHIFPTVGSLHLFDLDQCHDGRRPQAGDPCKDGDHKALINGWWWLLIIPSIAPLLRGPQLWVNRHDVHQRQRRPSPRLFISLAFMHAFWAMDRSGINATRRGDVPSLVDSTVTPCWAVTNMVGKHGIL